MPTHSQRYRGALLGLACGDALGTTLEFKPRGSFTPITDLVGGGPFHLAPGLWTDDTSMALCLAESLVEKQGFDALDQMQRYCRWWQQGYLSSTGQCFDIGHTTVTALRRFIQTGDPWAGSTHPRSAGNGSLMRLAPVVMFCFPDHELALRYAGQSSLTTHGAAECVDACRYFAAVLMRIFEGVDKATLTGVHYEASTENVRRLVSGAYLEKDRDLIRGTGYVVESLEAALWCFHRHESYRDAVLAAANLGDDADTTAAICGQLAGAYYGVDAIPQAWRDKLAMVDTITRLADALWSHRAS